MTVDSVARRQAILFEIAAVADRYECDRPQREGWSGRVADLHLSLSDLNTEGHLYGFWSEQTRVAFQEIAGKATAALLYYEAEKAKA